MIRALRKHGFQKIDQSGSYQKWQNKDGTCGNYDTHIHGIFSYEASDVALIILHSRESRMVAGYGAVWSALGGSRPREISFLANSIWLGARVGELDLGSGPSNSS